MEEKDVQRLLDMLYGMIDEAKSVAFSSDTVSYTHLTLPTIA